MCKLSLSTFRLFQPVVLFVLLAQISFAIPQNPTDEKAPPNDNKSNQSIEKNILLPQSREMSSNGDYIIKPGDVLEVFVWREPDLTKKATVRGDGKITIPLVQDVQASGLTPSELKKSLEEKLKDFIEAPNVTIIMDSTSVPDGRFPIFLVGKFARPGPLLIQKGVDIMQVISLVGGFQDFASTSKIKIVRNNGGEKKIFLFNYKDVMKGKNLEQNIQLEPGDMIMVP